MNMVFVFIENIELNFIFTQVRFNSIRNTLSLHEGSHYHQCEFCEVGGL